MFDQINSFDKKFSINYPDGNVPDNYDISEMQFTFDFIYLVYKHNLSIDNAIYEVAFKYTIPSDDLKNYLVENNYILSKTTRSEYLNQIKKYNTKSLKKILKANGLKNSGKREKIEERIIEHKLIDRDFVLSYKSKLFYKNKKRRMSIFDEFFKDYYFFDEFNDYYMDNFRKKKNKIPIDYVNCHIEKAINDKNHRNYILNLQILSEIYYRYEHHKNMLECVLKMYCVNINPVWEFDDLSEHGFAIEIYDLLQYLEEVMGKNRIISAYFAVWDSFNFESFIMSKYTGYVYLKDILNHKDYHTILQDLCTKFYWNDDVKVKKVIQKTLFDF